MSLILVDTSYTSFYRFFATLRWLSLAEPELYKEKKDDNKYDWSKNEKFMEKYEKMYLKSIIDLVKQAIYKKSKVIFCMDSPKENVWRFKYMKDYKADRCDLTLKNNFKPTFEETYNRIIPKIIKDNSDKISSLRMDKLEADDIIAVICKYYEKKDPDMKIYLISGDKDFLQLGRPNLIFLNYKSKKGITLTPDEAKEALKNKILNGDCSDNIPSIFPKDKKILSLKRRKELIEDENKLKEYLKENPEIKEKYELNKIMIDFNNIPKDLQKSIVKEFNKLY
jgi:5'-3' exonuclease